MEKQLEWTMHLDETYYMPVFGKRIPVIFTHGKGVYLFSSEEKKYMDMIGGIAVNVLGHAHPKLVRAISSQAKKFIHCSNYYYIESQAELARRLAEISFADRVFFCNSGAEANEGAIKLTRGYFFRKGAPRPKIVSARRSFHGRTMTTIAATGQEKMQNPFAPLMPGVVHVPYNDIEALSQEVDQTTCAVIIELVQGESGVFPADREYIQSIRKICDKTGTLLIVDEIQSGVARTGTFFAYEQYGITPDILTLAKGLAGGVPIGALLATENASKGFMIGDHGSTFGGNPLACSASLAVLDEIEKKNLTGRAKTVGAFLTKKLRAMSAHHELIGEIRGAGLLIGISLNRPVAAQLKKKCFDAGILVGSVGDQIIRLAPPLILTRSQASSFISSLDMILTDMEFDSNEHAPHA
ncbi:MAG: acetylornithine transaminase [Clostridiales bacterium]|nr:acetylornithine transaminase [Clostridiales bacterium]